MKLVYVGRIGRPHGIGGEVYLDDTSLGAEELRTVRTFEWRGRDGATRGLVLREARDTHQRPLVRFANVPHREAAAELVNGQLWADSAKLPDPGPGVVYTYQLIGLAVRTSDGRELGTVRDVMQNGPQTLYAVGEKGTLYPGHSPFLKHVDLAAGVITLDPPPGLEDL